MKKLLSAVILLAPALAFAQATPITDVNTLTTKILDLFNVAIYVLIALAVLFIVYNVVWYVIKPSGAEKGEALKGIGWGLVGLAIIVSIWGLVGVLTRSFNTVPSGKAIPNVSNSTDAGGIPANQVPVVR